jgi:hypothetical protein
VFEIVHVLCAARLVSWAHATRTIVQAKHALRNNVQYIPVQI